MNQLVHAVRLNICCRLPLAACVCAAAGCTSKPATQPPPLPKEDLRDVWSSRPVGVTHPRSAEAASGPAPLAYMVEQPAAVWVTDSTGQRWGPVDAPAQTIVRVAQPTGVAVGRVRLDDGPLPPGRTYTVHVGVPTEYRPGGQ